MERVFRNERHKELYEKFDRKRQEYFMVLGGATKEDAKIHEFLLRASHFAIF